MQLQIVTPEAILFDAEVSHVILPTATGELTILPHHIALVGILKAGEAVVVSESGEVPMAISGGFFQMTTEGVLRVMADTAERAEDIIETRAEEARQRAEAVMADRQLDKKEYAAIAAKMEKELVRLKVARKYRHKAHGGLNAPEIERVQH